VQAAEAERRRIERDLHDGVQQDLVALMAKVEVARRRGSDPAVAETLVEAQQLTRRAVQELRQLVQGIHPPVLTDEGLPSAVRSRAGALPFPVRVEVGPGATGRRFDPDSEAAAYFLVCEALTNVAKHAGATSAMVCIDADDHRLCVDVRDDGCGFTGPSTPRGLRGLQDRLEALGGRLDFGSLEGGGAYVRGELPA
jgi:signal transduction histidine kinase